MDWFDRINARNSQDRADQFRQSAAENRMQAFGAAAMGNIEHAAEHLVTSRRDDSVARGFQNEADGYRSNS